MSGWGEGSVGKALAAQTSGPDLGAQNPCIAGHGGQCLSSQH